MNTNVGGRGTFILVDGRCSNWEKVLDMCIKTSRENLALSMKFFYQNKHYLTPLLQKELKNKQVKM